MQPNMNCQEIKLTFQTTVSYSEEENKCFTDGMVWYEKKVYLFNVYSACQTVIPGAHQRKSSVKFEST